MQKLGFWQKNWDLSCKINDFGQRTGLGLVWAARRPKDFSGKLGFIEFFWDLSCKIWVFDRKIGTSHAKLKMIIYLVPPALSLAQESLRSFSDLY